MALDTRAEEQLEPFLNQSSFAVSGGVVTDLDGTVVHEEHGRAFIPPSVDLTLKDMYDLGRSLMRNELRFPLYSLCP